MQVDLLALPLPIAWDDVKDWRAAYRQRLSVDDNWRQGLSSVKMMKGALHAAIDATCVAAAVAAQFLRMLCAINHHRYAVTTATCQTCISPRSSTRLADGRRPAGIQRPAASRPPNERRCKQ